MAETLDLGTLRAATPVVAGLALVVLLFDSGLQLDFGLFGRSFGKALRHTAPIFLLTVLGVAAVGHFLLGMPLLLATVLGIAISNVDQVVSAGVLKHLRIADETRSIYLIEMAIYDIVCIPIIVSLLEVAQGAGTDQAGIVLRHFASTMSISLAAAVAAGVPWLFALRALRGHPHSYMMTFATMLGLYGATEILGGSGALSILLFGILVGNRRAILRRFGRMKPNDEEEDKVQSFHDEITFLVRTLFFLFLGASFSVGEGLWPVTSPVAGLATLDAASLFLVAAFAFLIVIVVARWVAVWFAARRDPRRRTLFGVFGRGLDTAVLATLPFLVPAFAPGTGYYAVVAPWQTTFTNLSLLLILLTVAASSVTVWLQERGQSGGDEPKGVPTRVSRGAS